MLPTLFHLGPLTLHTYGLLVAIGFIVGMAVLRCTTTPLGIVGDDVDRLAVLMLVTGILGARVMYYAVDGFAGLREDPMSFFRIWEGGLVFYGGVAGSALAAFIYTRRRRIRFLALGDALIPPLLIAHSFGRLGCLAAGCCYGKPAGAWPGIVFKNPESLAPRFVPLLPTQPLEAALLACLFFIAYRLSQRPAAPVGQVSAFYLCGYAVLRFLMEFLRGDDRGRFVLGFSPSQTIAIGLFLAGVGVFLYGQRKADT